MSYCRNLLSLLILLTSSSNFYATPCSPDMVVCTYNRPLQLRAFLESFFKYVTNYGQVTVIARIDKDFEAAYDEVAKEYSQCKFIKQSGENPRGDYKQHTIDSIFNTPSDYMLFGVDDIVVTGYIDLNECVKALEDTHAYGFYLRLGKNITQCLKLNIETPLPNLEPINQNVFKWQFESAMGDWNYPNSMDMTILRKADIKDYMFNLNYNTPNTLEALWSNYADLSKHGLCFEYAKIVNLQFNVVQDDWRYVIEKNIDTAFFLEKCNQGLKLDISDLYQMRNTAPHVEGYTPKFLSRFNHNITSPSDTSKTILTLVFHKENCALSAKFLDMLQQIFKVSNFIETGTFLGNTTLNAAKQFKKVYTVELSKELYENTKIKFKHFSNINTYNGHSDVCLDQIIPQLKFPNDSIIYLDAHYSGGCTVHNGENTPILKELQIIKKHHIKPLIIIDDIRFFHPQALVQQELIASQDQAITGYPTIHQLKEAILEIGSDYEFLIYNDLAIAYSKEIFKNVEPSKVIKALTLSRLFNHELATKQDFFELLKIETDIASAHQAEKESIKKLIYSNESLHKPKRFSKEYYLWNALIYIEEKEYDKAYQLLQEIHNLGIQDFRINLYRSLIDYLKYV